MVDVCWESSVSPIDKQEGEIWEKSRYGSCLGIFLVVNSVNQIKKLKEKSVREKLWNQATNFGLKLSG